MSSATKSLLLTATPLQNRLEELFGLGSVFEPDFFHSIEGFKERYVDRPDDYGNEDLAMRISYIAKRTLRRRDADVHQIHRAHANDVRVHAVAR